MMTEDEVPVVAQRTPPPIPTSPAGGIATDVAQVEDFREVRNRSITLKGEFKDISPLFRQEVNITQPG